MNTLFTLLEKIDNAKSLDFGDILSNSIELFKKVWLKGFLVILLIVIPAMFIGFVMGLLGLGSSETYLLGGEFDFNSLSDFYSTNVLYSLPQTMIVSTISIAFVAAFYRVCKQMDLGEKGQEDFFYFFNKEHLSKVLLLGVIFSLIATVAQLMFFLPYIYVYVPLSYFSIMLANNPNLSEIEIVKASFALGNKKWFISFGTLFVAGILGALGVLGCGIGLLFTISILYLPVYFIYKESVGFQTDSEIDKIGTQDELDY